MRMRNDRLSRPYPLGATPDSNGCNFSVYVTDDCQIQLALFDSKGKCRTFPLTNEYAGIRYIYIQEVTAGQKYGYLIKQHDQRWHYISDPYTKALEGPLTYTPPFTAKKSFQLPKCVVVDNHFDWQDTVKPEIPREATVLFETHVKGLTHENPAIPANIRGTYPGLIHPEMMKFYQAQGIRTLQFLPVAACMHETHLLEMNAVNYWGYNPYVFMAPDPRYAVKDAVTEFKTVVRELHKAGIEVILDVVYNHTAEGGGEGPLFNLRGLDPQYYLTNGPYFANFTGCGNTVDLSYQPALNLVMDTLRYWVSEYHIDGFRFDLAATLGRNGEEFSQGAAFFKAVAQDPILKQVKLIAEPWDIGPNGYQVGNFPFGWNETNDKLRDISRSFWRGDQGYLKEFATRLMGSRDLYSAANWPFKLTVNYITYHDGFTLQDLVSYRHKHNERNGEQNRDGHGDNRSENYGVEGPTSDKSICDIRARQKRNFMATVLFAFGMPHILTADLLSHSQQGNNNAYCQDNEISWLNWNLNTDQQQFRDWCGALVKNREQFMIQFIDAFSGNSRNSNRVFWRRVDGKLMNQDDWNQLSAVALHLGIGDDGAELLYLINQTKAPARFSLPKNKNQQWQVICDTDSFVMMDDTVSVEKLQPEMTMTILYFDPQSLHAES
ncbi:Glycogen debranching enzyme [Vibrio aerogenes CECT 7868]|uniref:Glycogen debranching enzyme n=2 Tax=Vibrio aerogenes TaxID=92172 RepID=A0A1M6BHU6_9VIBR|nr:glycogen debranching protein GlgX [Vibrio aerogenes]SHI48281.1 Glycogen debranching enzyme [Vibrio aerogenes CECT 7868]